MCGRFAVTTDPALLAEQIQALDEVTGGHAAAAATAAASAPSRPPGEPNYNVAPTTAVTAVVARHDASGDRATRRLRLMRWGLVPPWAKATADGAPAAGGPLLINARADKVASSPAFRASAKARRCLVPMAGWYEWQPDPAGPKIPYFLHAADGGPLFTAGLWSSWRPAGADPAERPLLSCTIVTTDAAGPLTDIHHRMPLTVRRADWDRWLDPDAPIDSGVLRGHGDLDRIAVRRVSRLVNSVANNSPELLEPVDPAPEQATLL